MKVALINPHWSFKGSVYFGCSEPHLPLELAYSRSLLERDGHETLLVDAHLFDLSHTTVADHVEAFDPDMIVLTTAPSYLFWRCAPPELRVPAQLLNTLLSPRALTVAVGPHGSSTPQPVLKKLGVDVVLMGECEEAVARLANASDVSNVPEAAYLRDDGIVTGVAGACDFERLPALRWDPEWIERHRHHHHRFDKEPDGPGAEVEASRGCPYACTFCAKIDFRDKYRRRRLDLLLEEIDGLISHGARYLYFIDEIFLPWPELLEALRDRPISFGVQTRIELWRQDHLALLGDAGCVSVEAGVESLSAEGREQLNKRCRLSTEELADRLIFARRHIPFVQANLIGTPHDLPEAVDRWRARLRHEGVWANDPVPLFPYPGSPEYRNLWGVPDGRAWERAHEFYLAQFDRFSDVQDERPEPLDDLERGAVSR